MSRYFNFNEIAARVPTVDDKDRSGILVTEFLDLHCEKVESIKNLVGRPPVCGMIIFLWTIKSFNAFTFVTFLVKEKEKIDELIISTYSINIRIIDAMIRLIDTGKVTCVTIFISETLQTRLPKVYDHLNALADHRSSIVKVIYRWNHSKIALMRCGDDHFVVEGSGNFSENAQHEQYIFLNSREVFEFRKKEILYES